jgi:pimeloyl-ACP methyl ester carboxylesterase
MPLHFVESGPDSAPSLIFLHGGGVSGWMWRKQVAAFQAEYHCLVPDLPEHGQSQSVYPFTISSAAAQVAELIHRHAHAGRAHLVGLSLGAQVGAALLGLAARLVDRALLTGALVRPIPGAGFILPSLWLYAPFKNMNALIRANQASLGVPAEYAAEFALDTRRTPTAALARILVANLSFRVPLGLGRLTQPVLITVGSKEPAVMRRSARELSGAMLGATSLMVQGHGHNWPLTAPDLFNQTLRAFLTDSPLPPALVPVPRR